MLPASFDKSLLTSALLAKHCWQIAKVAGPDKRITPMAPTPCGVAKATIVSVLLLRAVKLFDRISTAKLRNYID